MSDEDASKVNNTITIQSSSESEKSSEKLIDDRIKDVIIELNIIINSINSSRQIGPYIAQGQEFISNLGTLSNEPTAGNEAQATNNQVLEGEKSAPNQAATQNNAANTATTTTTVSGALIQTSATLAAINSIKTELCRLPLDFCEREYITNCIIPLGNAMELVSRAAYQLATSTSILTTSPIVPRKKGKLKDTIHTVYDMNEQVEDLYCVLKKRLKKLTCEND